MKLAKYSISIINSPLVEINFFIFLANDNGSSRCVTTLDATIVSGLPYFLITLFTVL